MNKIRIFKALMLGILMCIHGMPATNAYFLAESYLEGSVLTTGCWVTPSVPKTISPVNNETVLKGTKITFVWEASQPGCDAAYNLWYQYQVIFNNSENPVVYESQWLMETSEKPLIVFEPGLYLWRVRALDNQGMLSDFSAWSTFSIAEPDAKGQVLINEIMWAGSSVSHTDEWIELKNTTSDFLDISGWRLENAGKAKGELILPHGIVIEPNGFLLIANNPETSNQSALKVKVDVVNASLSLADEVNGNMVLKNSDGKVIDEAPGNPWPAGMVNPHRSMQRWGNEWISCINVLCNSSLYWDRVGGNDWGTPRNENLPNTSTESSITLENSSVKLKSDVKRSFILTYSHGEVEETIEGIVQMDAAVFLGTCSEYDCVEHEPVEELKVELNDGLSQPLFWH